VRSGRDSTGGEWIVLISLVSRRGKDGGARFQERKGAHEVMLSISRGGDDRRHTTAVDYRRCWAVICFGGRR
jgi:hypothetical protein